METEVSIDTLVGVFDTLPDVVFFAKDTDCRYTHVNLTLMRRLRLPAREDIIGRTAAELFPGPMGDSFVEQDRRVLQGESINDQLEVHLFANRAPGWCLTCKIPLRAGSAIRGVIGVSRDLPMPDGSWPTYGRVREVLDYLKAHPAEKLNVSKLARRAGLSVAQLERHFKRVFQLTPQQALMQVRVDTALRLLRGDMRVTDIAHACGFADHSAFSRQFKTTTGMTPSDYRSQYAR
ncbi:MAG: AraC family transcriptional regulator [Rhodanobacter sp.]